MAAEKRSRRDWEVIVDRWERSDMSRSDFARVVGVNPATLGWWRWKLELETEAPTFLEVVVSEPEPAPDFELSIGGVHVRVPLGFDADELRRLVDALC